MTADKHLFRCKITSPHLNLLDYSVWTILQELEYEGRHQQYANVHETEKAIRQKWNEM